MIESLFFFIAGAQRSGTTYLYHLLDQHDQISMAKPVKPEPKFFIEHVELADRTAYLERYHANAGAGVVAYGEKSTSYYERPEVAKRIYKCFPEAKIIFLLRNPVQRAISNYYFTYQHGLETRSLAEVFIDYLPEPAIDSKLSVSPYSYLERGNYTHHLPAYIDRFGEAKIKILLFDDIVHDQETVLSELLGFLELTKMNDEKLMANHSVVRNESSKPELVPTDITQTLFDYYAAEIDSLERLIGRNLDIWR